MSNINSNLVATANAEIINLTKSIKCNKTLIVDKSFVEYSPSGRIFHLVKKQTENKTNKILIFIVGGITIDEIADIKNIEISNTKIYLSSTSVITGLKFIKSFVKKIK